MPHIHTEPGQIDHTATAYIVRTDGAEPRMLLHVHKKLSTLLPVGGHIELTETPWAAVLHEIVEETGYRPEQLRVMQPKVRINPAQLTQEVDHPLPFCVNTHAFNDTHHHSDMGFLFATDQDPAQSPADGESLDIRWLTAVEIGSLAVGDMLPDVKARVLFALETALPAYEPVAVTEFKTNLPTL